MIKMKEKLYIWLIQTDEPSPLDKRTKKMRTRLLAEKILEMVHSVLWWLSTFKHYKKDWRFTEDEEFKIKGRSNFFAIKGTGYKRNISPPRFIDIIIVSWKFKKFAFKMLRPAIIIASMPPYDLAYRAVMFAKKDNINILVHIRDKCLYFFFIILLNFSYW